MSEFKFSDKQNFTPGIRNNNIAFVIQCFNLFYIAQTTIYQMATTCIPKEQPQNTHNVRQVHTK